MSDPIEQCRRLLREQLALLRQAYERDARPIVDRLASLEPPPGIYITDEKFAAFQAQHEFLRRTNQEKSMTDDGKIEQEIQAKGLTAPRVTPEDLRQNIADEFYFTAAQGISAAYPVPAHSIDLVDGVKCLTICVLVLKNGFTVTGESACASPENFNAKLGNKIARDNAVQKLWPLMGYALKQRLHETDA